VSTRVLLVRHGESEWNADGRWQGHADPPLSALGRAQARDAAAHIGRVDAVVASDLRRAMETAVVLAQHLGIGPVLVEERLREADAGEWTGLTRPEIERAWPGYLEAGRRPPAFERWERVAERAQAALVDLGARHPDASVLAVSHSGVVRFLERHLGEPRPMLANLAGTWFEVDGDRVTLGDRLLLLDPDHVAVTAPRSL
jgi:broad specificity phosphatase PhoE